LITYNRLWETMKKKGISTYYLRYKEKIGGGTMQRLQKGEIVSTSTLNMLCKILRCNLSDIAEYIDDIDS